MNIFKKITLANKLISVYKIVKDFSDIPELKEGIRLINEGISTISNADIDFKVRIDEIKEALK